MTADNSAVSCDQYLAMIKEAGYEPLNNLIIGQRLDDGQGIECVTPIHPAAYYDSYPKAGGVTASLVASITTPPGLAHDFKNSSNSPSPDFNLDLNGPKNKL